MKKEFVCYSLLKCIRVFLHPFSLPPSILTSFSFPGPLYSSGICCRSCQGSFCMVVLSPFSLAWDCRFPTGCVLGWACPLARVLGYICPSSFVLGCVWPSGSILECGCPLGCVLLCSCLPNFVLGCGCPPACVLGSGCPPACVLGCSWCSGCVLGWPGVRSLWSSVTNSLSSSSCCLWAWSWT